MLFSGFLLFQVCSYVIFKVLFHLHVFAERFSWTMFLLHGLGEWNLTSKGNGMTFGLQVVWRQKEWLV